MTFKTHHLYTECFDINYDPLYINRFSDSISVLNHINVLNSNNDVLHKLYFNFIDIYNNDLTETSYNYIFENVLSNDSTLGELLPIMKNIDDTILFNCKLIYFRNIQNFIENKSNLFKLEEFIESNYPQPYIMIRSEFDLTTFGYTNILSNNYFKKLY